MTQRAKCYARSTWVRPRYESEQSHTQVEAVRAMHQPRQEEQSSRRSRPQFLPTKGMAAMDAHAQPRS